MPLCVIAEGAQGCRLLNLVLAQKSTKHHWQILGGLHNCSGTQAGGEVSHFEVLCKLIDVNAFGEGAQVEVAKIEPPRWLPPR